MDSVVWKIDEVHVEVKAGRQACDDHGCNGNGHVDVFDGEQDQEQRQDLADGLHHHEDRLALLVFELHCVLSRAHLLYEELEVVKREGDYFKARKGENEADQSLVLVDEVRPLQKVDQH